MRSADLSQEHRVAMELGISRLSFVVSIVINYHITTFFCPPGFDPKPTHAAKAFGFSLALAGKDV